MGERPLGSPLTPRRCPVPANGARRYGRRDARHPQRVRVAPRAVPPGRASSRGGARTMARSWQPLRLRAAAPVVALVVLLVGWSAAEVAGDCVAVVNISSFYPRTTLLAVR